MHANRQQSCSHQQLMSHSWRHGNKGWQQLVRASDCQQQHHQLYGQRQQGHAPFILQGQEQQKGKGSTAEHHMVLLQHVRLVKVTTDATATAEASRKVKRQRQRLLGQQRRQEHSRQVGRQQLFHSQGSRSDSLDICWKLEGEPVRIFKEPAGGQKSELTTWTTCCQSRQNHNSSNRSVVVVANRKKRQTMATYKKLTDSAGDRSSKGKRMEGCCCVRFGVVLSPVMPHRRLISFRRAPLPAAGHEGPVRHLF